MSRDLEAVLQKVRRSTPGEISWPKLTYPLPFPFHVTYLRTVRSLCGLLEFPVMLSLPSQSHWHPSNVACRHGVQSDA